MTESLDAVIICKQYKELSDVTKKIILGIFKRCFSESPSRCFPFDDDKIYILELPGYKLAGFSMIHHESPGQHFESVAKKGAYMYNFCIDPEYRQKYKQDSKYPPGILSLLLFKHIVAAEQGIINIDVSKDSIKLIKYWMSRGFKLISKCTNDSNYVCMRYS